MKHSFLKIFLMLMMCMAALTSCKKFVDVNQDPNRVTENNITAELIFPQAAHGVGLQMAGTNFRFLNQWLGYWSVTGDFALPQDESSYNMASSPDLDLIWEAYYDNLFDLYQSKTKGLATGDTLLAGASMILSVKLWQELVDVFGDIPYSQAFHNDQTRNPKYDKAQDVYADLPKVLDTAVSFMLHGNDPRFTAADIVNHGNTALWIRFANTLRLRLLIRQSELPGFNPASEIAKIEATGGAQQPGENIAVNPGYSDATNQQNPFYGNYGFTPTGVVANTFNTANAYFINLLQSTNDPRLFRLFRPNTAGQYAGSVYGLAAGNPPGSQTSNIGPGLAASGSQDQWIYPAFESLFLQAEAIARGWMPGNAKAAYMAAVTENFVWLGVPDPVNAAAAYMTNEPIANWDERAGATPESQARFIAYQKYIALGGIDPIEAWSDLRRLNMLPDNGYISANPAKLSGKLPVRLPYPPVEFTTNGTSVKAVGNINIFTTKIFWQP